MQRKSAAMKRKTIFFALCSMKEAPSCTEYQNMTAHKMHLKKEIKNPPKV